MHAESGIHAGTPSTVVLAPVPLVEWIVVRRWFAPLGRRRACYPLGDKGGRFHYTGECRVDSNEGLLTMTQRIRAVYRDGAFRPEVPCNFPENSEVELLVQESMVSRPSVTDPVERHRILRQITKRMQENPLPPGAPRFSREELHERR